MISPSHQARVIGLLRPLKDVTVTAGETATFECELSYEGIVVEWFLKGQKLEPSDQVQKTFISFFPLPLTLFLSFFSPYPLFTSDFPLRLASIQKFLT